jgi:hypothetical protein
VVGCLRSFLPHSTAALPAFEDEALWQLDVIGLAGGLGTAQIQEAKQRSTSPAGGVLLDPNTSCAVHRTRCIGGPHHDRPL